MSADAVLTREKGSGDGREPDLAGEMAYIGRAARAAAELLARTNTGTKTLALEAAASAIRHRRTKSWRPMPSIWKRRERRP